MFSLFGTVKHKLSNNCFDWVAKQITAGCVCNDIAVVLIFFVLVKQYIVWVAAQSSKSEHVALLRCRTPMQNVISSSAKA